MKTTLPNSRRRRLAFTLIELLVVIGIIAILAAILLPVLASAHKHALVVKAQTEESDLVTAIQGYDSAYGKLPVSLAAQTAAGTGDFTYGGTLHDSSGGLSTPISQVGTPVGGSVLMNDEVMSILMDLTNFPGITPVQLTVNTNHQSNPQMTKFLAPHLSGDTKSPGVGTDLVYRDPWGNPYIITMDLNYDEMCKDVFYSSNAVSQQTGNTGLYGLVNPDSSADNFEYRGKVMVWSAGPDRKISPTDKANAGYNKDNVISWK